MGKYMSEIWRIFCENCRCFRKNVVVYDNQIVFTKVRRNFWTGEKNVFFYINSKNSRVRKCLFVWWSLIDVFFENIFPHIWHLWFFDFSIWSSKWLRFKLNFWKTVSVGTARSRSRWFFRNLSFPVLAGLFKTCADLNIRFRGKVEVCKSSWAKWLYLVEKFENKNWFQEKFE